MPRFFFHYHTPEASTYDDIGCEFETLELAYLDAYRSAVDLGAEMLKAQHNPALHLIEIAGGDGRILTELRFDEIFRRTRNSSVSSTTNYSLQRQLLREQAAVAGALRDEMVAMCVAARANLVTAHEVLRRARAV